MSALTKLFSLVDSNEAEVRRLRKVVDQVNALTAETAALSDDELRRRTASFRERLAAGKTLDDILPEAFAAVREAGTRTLKQTHFDVQLLGGIALHRGHIAEMKTGEGKTLVASLALYLNALEGKGAHLVTTNDYLAKTGAGWMAPIYHALGMTVSYIAHDKSAMYDPSITLDELDPRHQHWRDVSRRDAYLADITYGQNSEFGFDYLRDNMVMDLDQTVQRELHYGIVDEADSILIDEARTPLIISSQAEDASQLYYSFARVAARLVESEDYILEEKHHAVTLTEAGIEKAEQLLNRPNLYEGDVSAVHYLDNALKARALYHKDKEYIVTPANEIVIIDEFTGRQMPGRRWSDGLHQAVEAKEGVKIQQETRTHATITIQNYFRMYAKLAGMTGTAATEAEELFKVYKLEVTQIPTNRPMVRQDLKDLVYRTEQGKWDAVVAEVTERNTKGQPVLIGTTSVEKSQALSDELARHGIKHDVLNAKNHEREALIIADAGQRGAVTLSTNMAGRGVDILLGDGVRELGGLHVIGTERHEARRIDNQLRGRAGRQGDHGLVALLRLARGRAHPDLRLGAHRRAHGPPRLRRRGADRVGDGHRRDHPGAGEGRGPQLRHPQARARVRRRPQQPAQRDLRRAPQDPREGRRPRDGPRLPARRGGGSPRRERLLIGSRGLGPHHPGGRARSAPRPRRRDHRRDVQRHRLARGPHDQGGATSSTRRTRPARPPSARRPRARSSAGCSSARSTRTGSSTSRRWRSCARASTSAATVSRTRSSPTRTRPGRSSTR